MAETNGIEMGASTWTPPRRDGRWTRTEGRSMAEAFRASQLSVAEFARSHGLHVERVRRWVRRVEGRRPKARPASKLKFAPVRLAQPQTEAGLEVAVGAGVVRVRLDGVGSHEVTISGLNRTARLLAVYASSRRLLGHHARLATDLLARR